MASPINGRDMFKNRVEVTKDPVNVKPLNKRITPEIYFKKTNEFERFGTSQQKFMINQTWKRNLNGE
jgi:hypothetical protein